jgi:Arc/MetJ-type ribon-helix-helix transcriptional regulator
MIQTFEQFKQNNSEAIHEGLLDALKTRKQIVKLQGTVVDEYERLIEEDPKRFRSGSDVLKAVKQFASKAYDEIVTAEGALSFSQWWEDFEKAHTYMLDRTIFNVKK